jgi:hypothetical protein
MEFLIQEQILILSAVDWTGPATSGDTSEDRKSARRSIVSARDGRTSA